jgi:cell division protein FtsN
MSKGGDKQRGGFVLGLIVGLLLGLAIALGVALYITKVPIPFVNKLPQRTAEQDAQEAERNKGWDPNAPLAGKAGARAASGVVSPAPAPVATAPVAPAPVAAPATPAASAAKAEARTEPKLAAAAASKPEAKPAEPKAGQFFVQAGAYTKPEDAEQQRAKLAMLGLQAKVMEREQSGRTVYRVRLGPFDGREEAEGLQKKIEAAGMEANLVAVQR